MASSIWGQQRTTNDADLAIQMNQLQLEKLVELLPSNYMIDAGSLRSVIEDPPEFSGGQILNTETLDKVDLFLVRPSEYVNARMSRTHRVEVLPGVHLRFSSPEDTVILKLRWFELGRRISDRQWNDIVQILELRQDRLAMDYLRRWAKHFSVEGDLDLALEQVVQVL